MPLFQVFVLTRHSNIVENFSRHSNGLFDSNFYPCVSMKQIYGRFFSYNLTLFINRLKKHYEKHFVHHCSNSGDWLAIRSFCLQCKRTNSRITGIGNYSIAYWCNPESLSLNISSIINV